VAAAFGVRELYQATEAYASIANRMRLVTESAVELRAAQDAVFQSAQTARQPLAATAELYQRIAANQKALNLSGKDVASITDTISKSLAISGASAASANAALIQLGQAFASGTLRGEELNSVMEQAPALSQAIAAGMGVTIGQLRSLGAEGKLTAEAVVKALQDQADAVDDKFSKIANTIGGALQVAGNTLTRLVGELDQASGATTALAGGIIDASKFIDKFTEGSEALSTSITAVGTAMTIAAGRVAGGFAQQGAAALYAANASRVALNAAAASAKQDVLSAQAKKVDAKATLDLMTLELSAAESKVASDRVVMASEVSRIKMVQSALVSELALEQERMKSQISETGRAATVARMVEIRGAQVLINKQVEASERALAATTVASSAQVQAAYAKVTAAKVGVGETTAVVNAAVAASDRATAAASTFAGAGRAVLGLLGGPLGLVFTVGAVAASYFMFRDGANDATAALIDQNGTLDDSIQKFKELSAEQQRFQSSKWAEAQESALNSAASALGEYASRGSQAFNSLGMSGVESAEAFNKMVAEVEAGTRSLDSVTEWVSKNNQIMPAFKSMLEQTAAAYAVSGERADKYGKLLAQSSGVTTSAASETEKLAAAQRSAAESSGAKAGEWDKYIAKLTETRDLLGANAAAEAEYNAAKMGANAQQVAQAKLIGEQTVVLKAYQEAVKDGNKVEQAALKTKLLGLYTAEEAATQAAATQKQAYADTATAAESSAKRQITAIEQAANFAIASAARMAFGASAQNPVVTGYSLITNGGTAPAIVPEVKETALERVDRAIKLINEGTEANKKTDKAANAAAKAIENQAKALKDFEAQSAISTKSSNDMADAYLAGADSVRELAIQQKIEEELLKTGVGARDAVTAAVNREADAKDRLDIDQSIASMRTETTNTLAQATATLQGADALETFNIQKSMSIALSGKKIDIGSKEYEQLLEQTKAQLAANKALEQAGKVEGVVDRLNPQIKLLKDFTAEQEALNAAIASGVGDTALYQDALVKLGNEYEVNRSKATIWGQMTEGAVDRIDGVFADAWSNIGSGADSLWDNLVKGAKQAFGEIAHMLTTKPLLASISNWLTGTDNGQGLSSVWGKLLGGAGGSSGGTSGGGLFSGLAGIGQNLLSAWNTITGVGSSVASGYASGGIGGAISGGAGYYGNMLNGIASTLSSGFTSLIGGNIAITGATAAASAATTAALTGVTAEVAASTAATVGAEGITAAMLSGAVAEGAASVGTSIGVAGATTAAASSGLAASVSAALSSAAAMWPLAIVMGMYQSGKLYDAGVRPSASDMLETGGHTAAGKATMAPLAIQSGIMEIQDKINSKLVGGKLAAIISGSTLHQAVWGAVGKKLFGGAWETKDGGISLGVENGEFDPQQYIYQKKKGGLFSSSKKRTRYSDLDAETESALGAAYNDKLLNSMGLFSALGVQLSESVFDGLNVAATKISTQGKTPEAIQEELDKWFSGLGDSAVSAINAATNSGLENYNFEALTTFVNDLYSVNDSFDMLGLKLYDVSVSTGFMAEQLISMAGGLEALKAGESSFFENFYTDTEKADYALSTVNKQFEAMGVKLPGTRDAYRDMVEALDRTTESGRQMYVTLTSLSGNAAQAYSILEQRADAAAAAVQAMSEQLIGVAGNAQSALQRAISAQQKATTEAYNARITSLNDMVSTATENVSGLTSVGNDLGDALKALRGDSDDAVKMLRAQAQATLKSALATARSGGSLSGFTGLSDALDTVSTNNTDLYGSMEDFARDQGRTANVVAELNGINGKQLTTAEKSLKGLETQIELAKAAYDAQMAQFDSQLAFAQAQMDALNGVDNSVMGVTAAINAMNLAVVAALAGITGKASDGTSTNNGTLIDSVYKTVLGRDADAAGKAYWQGQLASGAISYDQLAQAIANAAKEKNQAVKAGYATGGLISGPGTGTSDSIFARLSNGEYVMRASAVSMFGTGLLDQMNAGQLPAFAMGGGIGETGPQLEVTGPSRIFNANQTASMLNGGGGNGELIAEVRQLRTENRQAQFQIVKLTQKIEQIMTQWNSEGTPKERDYAL
jgi:tape measure domain-containing protein